MAGNCDICIKRIALHSFHLSCSACDRSFHIKCLPFVSKTDSIYINRQENQWICIRCAEEILPFNNIDNDDDFYDALGEFWFNISDININDLTKKMFIPFEINNDSSHHPLFDVDPDLQYFNKINQGGINSDYYTSDSFLNKCKPFVDGKMFSLLHANIRSAAKNLNKLEN